MLRNTQSGTTQVQCRTAHFERVNESLMPQRFALLVTAITDRISSSENGRAVLSSGRAVELAATLALAVSAGCASPAAARSPAMPPRSGPGPTTDFARLEREVTAELNSARTNPAAYVRSIERLMADYRGTLLERPDAAVPVRTLEGARAAREAVAALRAQRPVPAVISAPGLADAARDLAVDQSRTGRVGHTGGDGSTPLTRIARYGRWSITTNESVGYGPFVHGRDVVQDLIIDDGVRDRGHRRNIYDPTARLVGVACRPHPIYKIVCVIDQAGSFTPK